MSCWTTQTIGGDIFWFESLKKCPMTLHAIAAGLETMRGVLTAQLPRAYDETTTGLVPSDKEERIVGVNVNIDGISSANAELKQRLQEEVLHPLEQWLSAYRSIKVGFGVTHWCTFTAGRKHARFPANQWPSLNLPH